MAAAVAAAFSAVSADLVAAVDLQQLHPLACRALVDSAEGMRRGFWVVAEWAQEPMCL